MVDFWRRFFHGLVPIFFTVYADFSRFVRDINGEKKNISLSMSFFTVSFSRFAPSRMLSWKFTTVVTKHYDGSKHYDGVCETPCFPCEAQRLF